ncbi:MAG: hypothetical protein Q8Q42_04530 [Nanoarchaeota archaeon]|nr:hypothetical protein [Nanoarchaeota archaeon]
MIKLPEDTPIEKVMEMQKSGKTNTEIIQSLQTDGYSFQQISEALNQSQAKIAIEGPRIKEEPILQPSVIYSEEKQPVEEAEVVSPPSPNSGPQGMYQPQTMPEQMSFSYPAQTMGSTTEDIEEIAESIIEEKWQKMGEEFGDMLAWKERVSNDLDSIKQELMRLENRFENLSNSVVGKVREYGESTSDLGIEIKAMGKLLSNIINPLANNVKELERIMKTVKK